MTAGSLPQDEARQWTEWVQTYGPAVRGYLLAMVRRLDVADELAQEVFCRAWQARHRYRESGYARAYLLRIADHLACDHARKMGREIQPNDEQWRQVEPVASALEPGQVLVEDEARRQLFAAIEQLSPSQKRVLLLRFYGDMSFNEIADVMECPLGTALSHCHRALRTLREQLIECEP